MPCPLPGDPCLGVRALGEVDHGLAENPGLVNQAPYGEGWMIRLKPEHADDMKKLMGHDDYAQLIEQEQA